MNRQWLASLADFLVENKIEHVVTSPGSRNAPLLLHLTNREGLKVYSHVDERSAAFLALGMAQFTKSTVALVCTSGSALLNYGPALSEAFYQQIPLLVLSADRPPEWLDQSDGQTIRQHNVFQAYIRKSFTLPIEINHRDDEWFIWRSLSEAIQTTMYPIPGPVHVNIPFREPLYQIEENTSRKPKLINTLHSTRTLSDLGWKELAPALKQSKRIMILAGLASPDKQTTEILMSLARFQHLIVLTDINSNQFNQAFIRASDDVVTALTEDEKYRPEILITYGGPIISKKLKLWLRKNSPVEHWHINAAFEAPDTFQCLTKVVPSEINPFLKILNTQVSNVNSTFANDWHSIDTETNNRRDNFLEKSAFSDFKACWKISQTVPKATLLHLSNSMPVRYAHFLNWLPDIQIYSNRGVSGIDGCVSTAVGSAMQFEGLTTLITGDLAMLYDSHALWNTVMPQNLRIIVLNNGGGGIFRIIDGPGKFAAQRDYFETPHQQTMEGLAKMHNLPYTAASNEQELEEALSTLYQKQNLTAILEIFTRQEINVQIYRSYFEYINSKIN